MCMLLLHWFPDRVQPPTSRNAAWRGDLLRDPWRFEGKYLGKNMGNLQNSWDYHGKTMRKHWCPADVPSNQAIDIGFWSPC